MMGNNHFPGQWVRFQPTEWPLHSPSITIRGWSETVSASTIDDNTIGKIFPPKLEHLS